MEKLTSYEMETIINYNAGEKQASVYTRDKVVMRRLDALSAQYPDIYRVEKHDEISKTYSLPKSYVKFRKPINLTSEQRKKAAERIKKVNHA